jgi:hypothetical protein
VLQWCCLAYAFRPAGRQVAQLEPAVRDQPLAKIAEIIGRQYGDGQMAVPYLTRMWLARRRYSPAAR